MKKRKVLIQCFILVATLAAFAGYLMLRQMNTDDVGPKITVDTAPLAVSVSDPDEAYLQGVTAYDEQDGDVTNLLLVESIYGVTEDHQVTVTYAAFDRAGNVTKAQRQVTLTDYRAPRFTLDSALAFPASSGIDVMDYIGAEDVIDGDILRRVRATLISNTGSLADVGTHDVKLRVTNSIGDISELILPVEVYGSDKYNAELELKSYLVYLEQGASFNAKSYLSSFSYGGEPIDLTSIPEEMTVTISSGVDIQTPGVYPVTYTATYTYNQTTYTAYSKLFVVVEG